MNKYNTVIYSLVILFCSIHSFNIVKSESTSQDDCPDFEGNSTKDRFGCLDSDGDGWSNPDDNWNTKNGADAFILDKTQWLDSDKDGFGDNASIGANNIDYWPNDRLRHKPVILIACDPASNTITIGEKSSFSCKVTNPMDSISVNIIIKWEPLEGISSEWDSREVNLNPNGEKGYLTMFSIKNIGEKIGLSGGEIKIWVQNQDEPSAIAKLPILVTEEPQTTVNEFGEDVSEAFSFSRMHEGVIQVSNKIEEKSGLHIPTWSIYLTLTIMFSISLKKPTMIFTKRYNKSKIYKNKQTNLNYEQKNNKKQVLNTNKYTKYEDTHVDIDGFDYVPKRLRK